MRQFVVSLALLGPVLLGTLPARAVAPAEKEVLAAMETWKQAMVTKDRAKFDKVLHPDVSYAHSSGLIETKAQAIDHVVKGTAVWEAVNFADTRVRVLGNTALVTGKVDYHQRSKDKLTVINLLVLSVWLKGPQGWQMVARQATRPTPAPQPSQPK